MKRPGHMKTPIVRLGRQRGQAYVEYIMITTVVFVSAIAYFWTDSTTLPILSIAALFKSMFGAYSFTLSLP
jgi:1,4-dihydroxy-2-naphthoate octaprenyltransferase